MLLLTKKGVEYFSKLSSSPFTREMKLIGDFGLDHKLLETLQGLESPHSAEEILGKYIKEEELSGSSLSKGRKRKARERLVHLFRSGYIEERGLI